MKKIVSLALLCCGAWLSAEDRPAITVLDFKTSQLSAAEIEIFIDYLSSQIVATNLYRVIDRMQRQALLKEIEFSRSDCTDEKCQLELGRLLSASKIIVGSIGKVGDWFILNIKLIQVETGETERTASEKYKDMNAMVEDGQRIIAALLGTAKAAEGVAVPKAAQPAVAETGTPAAVAYSTGRFLFSAVPHVGYTGDYLQVGAYLGGLYRLTPSFSLGLGVQGAYCFDSDGDDYYAAPVVSALWGDPVAQGFLLGLGAGYGYCWYHSGIAFVGQIGYVFSRFVIHGSVAVYGYPLVAGNLGFGYLF